MHEIILKIGDNIFYIQKSMIFLLYNISIIIKVFINGVIGFYPAQADAAASHAGFVNDLGAAGYY